MLFAWVSVKIGVNYRRDGGESEQLLNELGMHAFREKERSAGFQEVVEADVSKTQALQYSFELSRQGIRTHRLAKLPGECEALVLVIVSQGPAN